MTRFACFYIENGIIQAPIEVMRFDQSLYEILGDRLIALSAETECLASTDTLPASLIIKHDVARYSD